MRSIRKWKEEDVKEIYEVTPKKTTNLDLILMMQRLKDFHDKNTGDKDFAIVEWGNQHWSVNPDYKVLGYSIIPKKTAIDAFLSSDSKYGRNWPIGVRQIYEHCHIEALEDVIKQRNKGINPLN